MCLPEHKPLSGGVNELFCFVASHICQYTNVSIPSFFPHFAELSGHDNKVAAYIATQKQQVRRAHCFTERCVCVCVCVENSSLHSGKVSHTSALNSQHSHHKLPA
jgi:hypothetical protein